MSSLLDLLQAASNSAASNVSAPVDAIAWLLKKAGIDVGTPVGGSDWMARQGLTRPVQQSGASLAGETAGLFAPIAAAAKAPQIARGLLQGAENMAAPRTLRPDQGAIVWHGSPHKFDRFDASKIGTGEGAQAYGHGLYFADAPEVAMSYQPRDMKFENVLMQKSNLAQRTNNYAAAQVYEDFLLHKTPQEVASLIKDAGYTGGDLAKANAALEFAKKQYFNQRAGALYKVDLPDSAISRMLDWDKPLSQQSDDAYKVFRQWFMDKQLSSDPNKNPVGTLVIEAQRALGSKAASETLRNAGIPGIRYLDGGSRGAGTGTSNFVVFPGEESLLTILERNGVPLR